MCHCWLLRACLYSPTVSWGRIIRTYPDTFMTFCHSFCYYWICIFPIGTAQPILNCYKASRRSLLLHHYSNRINTPTENPRLPALWHGTRLCGQLGGAEKAWNPRILFEETGANSGLGSSPRRTGVAERAGRQPPPAARPRAPHCRYSLRPARCRLRAAPPPGRDSRCAGPAWRAAAPLRSAPLRPASPGGESGVGRLSSHLGQWNKA